MHDAIPVKRRLELVLKHINTSCSLCDEEEESFEHLFLKCPLAKQVWFGADIAIHSDVTTDMSMADWLTNWIKLFKSRFTIDIDLLKVISLLWHIWIARNTLVFNNSPWDPHIIMQRATSFTHQNFLITSNHHGNFMDPARNRLIQPVHWIKPPNGYLKVNFDGANSSQKSGVGIVVRDHTGSLIFARAIPINSRF
ncbi:PREDICTED: uncharacterized protein LOC104604373 [Nelumbo nucifera]|uniref:Uncharacterized protein LOC104604373 n=1 Tax=Nelumbo nucifera TaxID=4432 RepID=A0A1U8AIH0_NELNU|nr:PREDICTED: uncharacterized protein LOC104604373 [Nelumbo nucifera]